MELLSYVFSLISLITCIIAPFCKKMRYVLILAALGNFAASASYLLVGSYTGGIGSAVATVQIIINYTFTSKGRKIPIPLMVIYAAILVTINLLLWGAWYDALTIITAITFVLCMAQNNVKAYRIICLINVFTWLFYDSISGAYGNLIVHGIQFVSTITSVFKYRLKEKEIIQ